MLTIDRLTRGALGTWTLYETPKAHVVLTARGKELLETDPNVLPLLRDYRRAVIGRTAGTLGVREYIASGGNSDVYTLGGNLAMKEASSTQSLWLALDRMDTLCDVIEEGLPRWLDMPHHYGVLTSAELNRQYMLMQKIDAGVTVEHVLSGEAPTATQNEVLNNSFGNLSAPDKTLIQGLFDRAGRLMTEALVSRGLDPEQYMPDWHEGNMLIEKQRVPIAGSPYKLSIIDQ